MSSHLAALTPHRTGPGSALARTIAAAGRTVVGLVRALRHRRDVQGLLELDDRTLKDIGLVRNDVTGVLSAPLSSDPSVLLRLRAVERRAEGRRRAAAPRAVVRVTIDA